MLHYQNITIQWNKMRTCIRFHVYSTRPIFSNLQYRWHDDDCVVRDLLPIYRLHYDKRIVEAQFWIVHPHFVVILRRDGSKSDELLLDSCCVERYKIDVLSEMFHELKKKNRKLYSSIKDDRVHLEKKSFALLICLKWTEEYEIRRDSNFDGFCRDLNMFI